MSSQPRRIRLKPWLVAQVNSGQYPGLCWVETERKQFCIPWRHATRHTPNQEDENTIFKAWAKRRASTIHKWTEIDSLAKWKANLLLNKSRSSTSFTLSTKDTPMQPYKICFRSGRMLHSRTENPLLKRSTLWSDSTGDDSAEHSSPRRKEPHVSPFLNRITVSNSKASGMCQEGQPPTQNNLSCTYQAKSTPRISTALAESIELWWSHECLRAKMKLWPDRRQGLVEVPVKTGSTKRKLLSRMLVLLPRFSA
uniref:Uncharacterized protein n=1 Tax=Sphaerodactylus townsendi TaxID=933632 RepID=A0ACB8FLD5_9SAUR